MLETEFLGIKFKNPVVLASGILGVTAHGMNRVIENGAGGVTVKSLSLSPRTGHPNPTMLGEKNFFLNAVGLSNPGIEEGVEELKKFKEISKAPLFGSIFAGTVDEFVEVSKKINEAPLDLLEIDISCPNVGNEFPEPFAYSKEAVATLTKRIKDVSKVPISIKLSPNTWNIAELAQIAEDNGANAITAVNTLSGMEINVEAKSAVLSNKQGGVSGPALLPIALNCVYQISKAVKIPVIGTGGVTTGEDAMKMIMAGASLVGVGSAVYYRGEEVFGKIVKEMEEIMERDGIKSLDEIRGVIHK